MARQIIILETSQADGGQKAIKVVFWVSVPQDSAYPKPTFQSAVDATLAASKAGGPTSQEISDLRSGLVLEEVRLYPFASSRTDTEIKADLQQLYADRVAAISAFPKPILLYGASFDGVTWSA